MGIFGKMFRRRKGIAGLTLEEVRVEEKRLEIRENQHLAQIDKHDKRREEIFNQGAKTKSPARRRIYARRFGEVSQRISMIERELTRVVKELMTLGRLRSILERKRQGPMKNLLENLKEEEVVGLTTLLEDDKITEEVYLQKLDTVLGVVNDPAYESTDLGTEGMEVMKTWEQMDEGELEFDEALKEATHREGSGGRKEADAREPEAGETEAAS